MSDSPEYRYLGNFSAVDPAYSRGMQCHDCRVSWTGCWDNFQCPECGEGELPGSSLSDSRTLHDISPEEIADEVFVTPDDRTNSEEFIRQSQANIDEILEL